MTLFFGIIGALAFLIFGAYESISGNRYEYHDENKMMYMTAAIITAVIATFFLFVCIAAGTWLGVICCLVVIAFCILLANMFYDGAHHNGKGR